MIPKTKNDINIPQSKPLKVGYYVELSNKILYQAEPHEVEKNKIRSLASLEKKTAQDLEKNEESLQVFNTSTGGLKILIVLL